MELNFNASVNASYAQHPTPSPPPPSWPPGISIFLAWDGIDTDAQYSLQINVTLASVKKWMSCY